MATDGGGSRVEQRLTAILGKWINYAKRCGALYPEGSRFRTEWEIRASCYYRVLRLVNKLF